MSIPTPTEHRVAPRFSIIVPTYKRRKSLELLVDSLLKLAYPADQFEIIIVDDGSTDDTGRYLHGLSGKATTISIQNSGPAVARNKGANIARGEFLVFIDDDCVVPDTWLLQLDHALKSGRIDALGGNVRNMLKKNLFAVAYDETHQFFVNELNRVDQNAPFLTTNNFTCRSVVFNEHGGFDERFHVGGEDREIVSRLIAAGHAVLYEPSLVVDHFHDFDFKRFVQQYYRFGKGAYLLYTITAREREHEIRGLSFSEYLRFFCSVGRGRSVWTRVAIVFLTLLAQFSTALGYAATSWEGLEDIPGEKKRIHAANKLGIQGRVRELVTYLLGTILSSALGFLAFFMLGRSLSVTEFGVFTFAFSLSTLIHTVAATGLVSAITRQTVELLKDGDAASRSTMLKSAGLLFGVVIVVQVLALAALWDPLFSGLSIAGENRFLSILILGTTGAAAFDFLSASYQIGFKLLALALLRFAVSFLRIILLWVILASGMREPVYLYAAFFAPNWIGALVAFFEYARIGTGKGKLSADVMSKVARYAGWQTLSSATIIFLQHAGSLVLASTAGENEVGLYGLGLTFSFIYGVVGVAIGSYFFPIVSRLRSDDDVREFIRRTQRIGTPIIIACIVSLGAAVPLFMHIFGPEKGGAVPVFVVLSLAAILGIRTVGFMSLFHYFLKPKAISYSQLLSITVFGAFALLLVEVGALGMALAYLASRVTLYLTLMFLIRSEFSARGISR